MISQRCTGIINLSDRPNRDRDRYRDRKNKGRIRLFFGR